MGSIAIHCNPAVGWQAKRAPQIHEGLKRLGIHSHITTNRQRETDHAVLLGTTFWRSVEATGDYLLVDRASYGDPDFVQLVWNGHGRRGDHKVPTAPAGRFRRTFDGEVFAWSLSGKRIILCGQTESYCKRWRDLKQWYDCCTVATHFRKHPAGDNPTNLQLAPNWGDAGLVITLNSSVGVESVLCGIPTVTMDEGAMAWDVTGHSPDIKVTPDRTAWLEWLSWTQWHWDEIEAGTPIRHLFEEL